LEDTLQIITYLQLFLIVFWVIIIISIVSSIILMYYYFFYFTKVSNYSINKTNENTPKVSVIICAKNEEHQLRQNIRKILLQDYLDWELILVNDESTDNTWTIMNDIANNHNMVKLINIENKPKDWRGKKYALLQGIKAAQGDWILLTDADCQVTSAVWIRLMMQPSSYSDIILGYAPYKANPTWLNKIIRAETYYTALLYMSAGLHLQPYMSVGRNVAYRKAIIEAKYFEAIKHSQSGDDDLLIQQIQQKYKVSVCTDEASFVYSAAPNTFALWWQQKRRHLSTARKYSLHSLVYISVFNLAVFTSVVSSFGIFIFTIFNIEIVFFNSYYFLLALALLFIAIGYLDMIKMDGIRTRMIKQLNGEPQIGLLHYFLYLTLHSITPFLPEEKISKWRKKK